MPDAASTPAPARVRAGLVLVALTFLVVMALGAVPTPLYVLYEARDGFGPLVVTVVFSVYAVGVLASLLLAGHLSDTRGRRRMLAPAVALSAVSATVFWAWPDLPGLLLARLLSGASVGVVTATATAWITELNGAAGGSARRAQVVAAIANIGGLGVGPLVAGVLAEHAPHPLALVYASFAPLLLACAIGLLAVPETRPPAVPVPRYRPQRLVLPDGAGGRFAAAVACGGTAFATFGLFTSLAPSFLAGTLHHGSRSLAGGTAFAIFTAAVVVQVVFGDRAPREVVTTGVGGVVLGMAMVATAVWLPDPSLWLFLAGGVVAGAGSGLLFKGAMGTVLGLAGDADRAGVLAAFFTGSYVGISVPVVGLGLLTQTVQPRVALLAFAALLVVVGTLAARAVRRG